MTSVYDDAAEVLRSSRLYVDPEAEQELEAEGIPFGAAAQEDAKRALDGASTPIYVAVMPGDVAESGQDAIDLGNSVGRNGTYVVLSGEEVSAASNTLDGVVSAAGSARDEAENVSEFIEGLVPRIEEIASGADGAGAGSTTDSGGGGWLPLAILAAAGGGGFLLYRRNKLGKERAQLEQVRGALDEDITAYGERLSSIDLDVRADSAVPIEARQEYSRALDLYENAKLFADRAEKPTDLKPVTNALEEGRWLLGCVDARLKQQPLPDRRLPCFFDPSHGPSAEDIEWAPPGGVARIVPACAADALRIKNGDDPSIRMVPVGDGERRPYWDAGPAYGGWAGGYFGGFLPGMLMGTMLGSVLANPIYVDGGGVGAGGGDGGGFDGGDFGGGFDGGGW